MKETDGRKFTPETMTEFFRDLPGNQIVALDCCYAGKYKSIGLKNENVAFLGSSQSDEASWYRSYKGGIFTNALVKALKKAVSTKNNYVKVDKFDLVECQTAWRPPEDQNFTMNGQVMFTMLPQHSR